MFTELITTRNGKAITTSVDVATVFDKQHIVVMRTIKNLECSQDFRECNFAPSFYQTKQNRILPMMEMTKEGFTFLVDGYRGTRARRLYEVFIAEFNLER